MVDIKYLLEQPDKVAENNRRRGRDIDVSFATKHAKDRAESLEQVQELRTKANELSKYVSTASAEDRPAIIEQGKLLKEQIKEWEEKLTQAETLLNAELFKYPNILRDDVPTGTDGSQNEQVRTFLEPTKFSFTPKDHLGLGEHLGIIDVERAAKVSGARFTYLKGDGVLLEFALIQYALSELLKENFIPVIPPHLISIEAMAAMGYLQHGGEEEIYHLKNDPMVLIGTSEQALGPMHMNEVLDESQLPLRYAGFSPCYRREAGSYGKDTRGILRVHQFDKVEMFSFTVPENSDEEHEKLLAMEEKLMQGLELPHRVMKLCSGDTGTPSARTYDIETWMPSQNMYRETHSTSNTTDFQTRRLNIRVRRKGKNEFAHALNGTAFAIGRTLIAILENYQEEDGSIVVPKVLRQWIGKEKIG
ncbi:serine--tRNA ligase [Candidatus Uhrbacteria bacterium]|nr:serine--tRNA ligase [Candidatus Uhrbacteria bacterium]